MQFDAALAAGNCRSLDSQVGGADHFRPPSPFPAHSLAAGTYLPASSFFFSSRPCRQLASNRIRLWSQGFIFRAGARDGPT